MVARAIEQRAATVMRQIAQLQHIAAEILERLQRARKILELALIFGCGIPVTHHNAIRHIEKRQAHRRLRGRCKRRHHRIQKRKRDSCRAHATQHRSSRKRLASDVHRLSLCATT